jgi:type I restriction enzyme S subunit
LSKYILPFAYVINFVELLIKSLLKVANRIKQEYQEAKAYLDQLDQSILAKAFRGELVPQNPNDEPASVLLERIRTERAKREAEAKAVKKSSGKTAGRRSRKVQQQDLESNQLELPGLE